MKSLRRLIDTTFLCVALLLAACADQTPQVSDTERLIGEALEAVGNHDLPTAEQRAYSAAILSADSAEMADALTMLSLRRPRRPPDSCPLCRLLVEPAAQGCIRAQGGRVDVFNSQFTIHNS